LNHYCLGYTTKRVPAIAAKIGLISGCSLYILSQFFLQPHFIDAALAAANAAGIIDKASLALVKAVAYPHFLDVMAILFALNIVIMFIIGKLYPREEAFVQEYTEQVDITPWKYIKQAGIAVCIILIGVYIYFI
jgi:SSS family solute:Na+ symporter